MALLPESTILNPVRDLGPAYDGTAQGTAISRLLGTFNVSARVVETTVGPAVIRHELEMTEGVRMNRVTQLHREMQAALRAETLRVLAPIPGTDRIGLEIPNPQPRPVSLRELVESPEYLSHKGALKVPLGRGMTGQPVICDLATLPHLLIAGATGSGKSVALNSLIASIMYNYSPVQVRLILVDPKKVELAIFKDSPHLFCPTITEMTQFLPALEWAMKEVDGRYARMAAAGVRNIDEYNRLCPQSPLERLIIFVDEFAEALLIDKRATEAAICRLAQLSRASGVTLVLATQRPTVSVVTGNIKANVPGRLAFAMASKGDSRTILDDNGAEALVGRGDGLFLGNTAEALRMQGVYVADNEINSLVQHWQRWMIEGGVMLPCYNFGTSQAGMGIAY